MKIIDKISLCLLSLLVLLLMIKVNNLEDKIDDIEQRDLEIHEYTLNSIG